jgi:GTPase SAR1 family protein
LKIAVFGKSGAGKSKLLNIIADDSTLFKEGTSLRSETSKVKKRLFTWPVTDVNVIGIDTIGYDDNRAQFDLSNFGTMVEELKNGINLALILIPITTQRLEKSDIDTVITTISILGRESLKHIFIVFT